VYQAEKECFGMCIKQALRDRQDSSSFCDPIGESPTKAPALQASDTGAGATNASKRREMSLLS